MPEVDRRSFVRRTLAAVGGFFAALFGAPGVAAVIDPVLRSATRDWVKAGAAAELVEGEPRRFAYEVAAGWEQRKEVGYLLRKGGEILAFSARCTHLGCKVKVKDGTFACPCHKGVFDLDGQPKSGPVQEPLTRFETRVGEDGQVEVRA